MNSKPDNDTFTRVVVYSALALLVIASVSSILFLKKTDNEYLTYNAPYIDSLLSYNRLHLIIEVFLATSLIVFAILANRKFAQITSKNKQMNNMINQHKRDLEEQSQLVESITALYEKTIKSSNQKSEFFYNMSHELKTPLSVILGAIQLIEQKNTVETERRKSSKHLVTIKQNCYRLLRLINNILDLSRIESGYIKTNLLNCNIVYLVEEITQSVIPYIEQKGLSIEFDTLTEEVITAVDIDKIERIVLNLLSNAIKFSRPGGKISVKMAQKNNNVIIRVKDSGIGIPKDMQASIFERYRQVDSNLTMGIEGSGLGLSIVKSFVALHKGNIKVKSQENKGSEFVIEIPIRLCEECAVHHPSKESSQDKIIEAINIEFSDIYTIAS